MSTPGDERTARRRIVSITDELPYPGIPHAGGEYYRRLADLLAADHHLTLIAPVTWKNDVAVAKLAGTGPELVLIDVPPQPRHWWDRARRLVPALRAVGFLGEVHRDPRAVEALAAADVIDLQWFEQAVAARSLRRRWPEARLVATFHDVVSQGYARQAVHARSLVTRLSAWTRCATSLLLEGWTLRAVDVPLVFSDKDADLLRRRWRRSQPRVVFPPLDDPRMAERPVPLPERSPTAVFVGAFFRPENDEAARWLLGEVWPLVLAASPGARLTVAGAGPSREVLDMAARLPGVETTGYVDDLGDVYRSARVALSPSRRGAGVKFKSISPMLWGVPVVATTVGAEGVDAVDAFWRVTDSPSDFAAAVVAALEDPASCSPVVEAARDWAVQRYTEAAWRVGLRAAYA